MQKRHIIQCLERTFVRDLENGEKITLTEGMKYVVFDRLSTHRSIAEHRVKL